jgi:hypothetical protein
VEFVPPRWNAGTPKLISEGLSASILLLDLIGCGEIPLRRADVARVAKHLRVFRTEVERLEIRLAENGRAA